MVKRLNRKINESHEKSGNVTMYVNGVWKFSGGFNGLARALHGIMNDDTIMQACINYCNSFGDPLIEEPFISPRDVAYTTADVVEAEYNDANSAEDFSVYIGDYRNGVNIEILDAGEMKESRRTRRTGKNITEARQSTDSIISAIRNNAQAILDKLDEIEYGAKNLDDYNESLLKKAKTEIINTNSKLSTVAGSVKR